MKLKIALALIVGLVLGAPIGFYAVQMYLGDVVAALSGSRAEFALSEHTILLKLLDEGKVDAAKSILLSDVQGETLMASALARTNMSEANSYLVRYARLAGDLPSVRDDTSELGAMVAKARASLPPVKPADAPKSP